MEQYTDTIDALLCVSIFALLTLPHHKHLLRWCILRISRIHAQWWSKQPVEVAGQHPWNLVLRSTLEPLFDYGTVSSLGIA